MRTKDELFREALRVITARRQNAVMQAKNRRDAAHAAHPELVGAEDARTRAGLALTMAAANGKSLDSARAGLARAEAALAETMRAAGYAPDELEPRYTCPLCRDTGTANGSPCTCVAAVARTLRRNEINASSPMALCGFDTFDPTRYPSAFSAELGGVPSEYMGKTLELCRRYAAAFSPKSPNLMFTGSAGLGKTHLALAVADAVLNRGFDVLYTSAAALAAQLGREHFDYDNNDPWLDACKEADLLILDDLGTEYINSLTISVLYELINTRMLTHRPTIYTTNITDQSVMESRYTEKVASRIFGNCRMFKFFGDDQRLK